MTVIFVKVVCFCTVSFALEQELLKRLDKLENMQKVLISTVRYQRGQIQHLEDDIDLIKKVTCGWPY